MSEEDNYEAVSVHAGFPNPAADMSLQSLDLNSLLIAHRASSYLFRVRGDHWQEAGVFDGDIAIVDRGIDPRKNDVVMWWSEHTTDFRITTYSKVANEARIWGVITSTIHQFREII